MVVGLPLIALAGYLGITLSVRTIVIVGALEFLIVLALGLSGLISPGPGGFTFSSFSYGFNPGHIATSSGFALAVVFTVQGLTGWEAAVPLAEETKDPKRNVPRATMTSIAIIGAMLVIVIWGQVIGWGTTDLAKLPTSAELPALTIAHRVWGSLWWLALIAMFTSVFGASLACQNVATRMWYGMGRSGVLPAAFGRTHPTRKTPTLAVTAQLVISVVLGLPLVFWLGAAEIFNLTLGFVLVIAVIFIYVVANLGVVRYYWREGAGELQLAAALRVPDRYQRRAVLLAVQVVQPGPGASLQLVAGDRRRLAARRYRCPRLPAAARLGGLAGQGQRRGGR